MSDSEILKLYKNLGETPLECIERFRAENPVYKDMKMTYLGRLDPMAEGLLLVLAGNTRAKDEYLSADKTYEFEVLWGFDTDTLDILGKVTAGSGQMPKKLEERMPKLLAEIRKKKVQAYPAYSSRTVEGKPLFEWAREKKIEEIDIPQKGIKIFSIEHENTRLISKNELLDEIIRRIDLVKGDFRQAETIGRWQDTLRETREKDFLISSFKASVSSGTYIRGLAHDMGEFFETGAITFWIKRTRVGGYNL
ncbi:MAG: tRNA pseudouridine55 synthase [Parcubacteria group bacterium]|nr:tRNA pseudouridine55 synthase [Parcubacteria group bacterium]